MTATESIPSRSLFDDMLEGAKNLWTKYNDLYFNIRTRPDGPLQNLVEDGRPWLKGDSSDDAKYDDNTWYESPDYWYLHKIARMLRPERPGEGVFYDIGSGKGRVLCIMARQPFKRVVGVELFAELCAAARANARKMRGRKAPIDVIQADAAQADMSDGTIYFMFNPFGRDTMYEVLQNLRQSLRHNPRDIIVVYYNAVHEDMLQASGWLTQTHAFKTFTRRQVSFWRNTRP